MASDNPQSESNLSGNRKADEGRAPATTASPRFAAYFRVRQYEMDALGHVNNAVYLHYLEQAAYEHSSAAGFDEARTRALGGIWIVRKHEIEYLRPATGDDILQVVTWAVEFRGARAFRDYAIYRYDGSSPTSHEIPANGFLAPDAALTGDPVVRARTLWAWTDLASGRPRRIPDELYAVFLDTPSTHGPAENSRTPG